MTADAMWLAGEESSSKKIKGWLPKIQYKVGADVYRIIICKCKVIIDGVVLCCVKFLTVKTAKSVLTRQKLCLAAV